MCRIMQEVREEGILKGIQEGRREGKREGKREEKKQIAAKMLELGINTIEEISSVTGLSVREVEELKTEHGK